MKKLFVLLCALFALILPSDAGYFGPGSYGRGANKPTAPAQGWTLNSESGLVFWMDPENGVTVSGSAVTQIIDRKGGVTGTPAADVNRPTIANGGSGWNNQTIIQFDGSNDSVLFTGMPTLNNQMHVFIVVDVPNSNGQTFFDWMNASNASRLDARYTTAAYRSNVNPTTGSATTVNSSATAPRPVALIEIVCNLLSPNTSGNPALRLFINGTQVSSAGSSLNRVFAESTPNMYLGRSDSNTNYFPGKMGWMAVYNEIKTGTALTNIRQAFYTKYGISGS